MFRNTDQWVERYKSKGALWIHDGNRHRPHARLSPNENMVSLHSNGFFDSRPVIEDESLTGEAASDLLQLFREQGGDISKVQGCVGPQKGATKLAKIGSEWVYSHNIRPCFWASPAKHEEAGKKSMVFSDSERSKLSGRMVLPWEDVLTTGSSVGLMVRAVEEAGGIVLPYVLVLVNRSGLQQVDGRRIVALIKRDMPKWEATNCPLCAKGSKAIRPKEGENWDLLNASYQD